MNEGGGLVVWDGVGSWELDCRDLDLVEGEGEGVEGSL